MNSNTKRLLDEKITENYEKYLTFARNMDNGQDDPNDILNECILDLYEKTDEKIESILSYLDFYLIQMIKFSSVSKTSRYQTKYNRMRSSDSVSAESVTFVEDEPDEQVKYSNVTFADIEQCLAKHCDWYVKEVFMRYVKSGLSFNKFSKQEAIPVAYRDERGNKKYRNDYINVSSLYKAYRKGKDSIREHLQTEPFNESKRF